jgi:hypothetical protein
MLDWLNPLTRRVFLLAGRHSDYNRCATAPEFHWSFPDLQPSTTDGSARLLHNFINILAIEQFKIQYFKLTSTYKKTSNRLGWRFHLKVAKN